MKEIPIERLKELVDYNPHSGEMVWRKDRIGRGTKKGNLCGSNIAGRHARVQIDGVMMYSHRVAWALHYGEWPIGFLDHINRIKHDNRISNLRVASASQNAVNKGLSSANKTGMRGVTQLPGGKWQAQIQMNGKNKYLGLFSTKEEAAKKYDEHARILFGEFYP